MARYIRGWVLAPGPLVEETRDSEQRRLEEGSVQGVAARRGRAEGGRIEKGKYSHKFRNGVSRLVEQIRLDIFCDRLPTGISKCQRRGAETDANSVGMMGGGVDGREVDRLNWWGGGRLR